MPYNTQPTNLTCSGPHWGILALGRFCTDLVELVPSLMPGPRASIRHYGPCARLLRGYNGCLPFSEIIRMELSLHKGKRFSEFNDQPNENGAYHLLHSIPSPAAYFTRSCEKGPGNGRFSQMVRAFREFRSERKKRTTSGSCPQFPKRFSGKLPFRLTSNRNFRIFWLNGKHPIFTVCRKPATNRKI